MNENTELLRRRLATAQADALKVGDSPVRADRVTEQVQRISADLLGVGLGEERTARVAAHLQDALRVLRRDDDGREAAKHLQAALKFFDAPPPKASPFLDD